MLRKLQRELHFPALKNWPFCCFREPTSKQLQEEIGDLLATSAEHDAPPIPPAHFLALQEAL